MHARPLSDLGGVGVPVVGAGLQMPELRAPAMTDETARIWSAPPVLSSGRDTAPSNSFRSTGSRELAFGKTGIYPMRCPCRWRRDFRGMLRRRPGPGVSRYGRSRCLRRRRAEVSAPIPATRRKSQGAMGLPTGGSVGDSSGSVPASDLVRRSVPNVEYCILWRKLFKLVSARAVWGRSGCYRRMSCC